MRAPTCVVAADAAADVEGSPEPEGTASDVPTLSPLGGATPAIPAPVGGATESGRGDEGGVEEGVIAPRRAARAAPSGLLGSVNGS